MESQADMEEQAIEGFRLSPQQERLWLLGQSHQSSAYNTVGLILLEGELEADKLQAALERVVAENEILRTTFYSLPGMTIPMQVINRAGLLWHENYDLSQERAPEQRRELNSFFRQTSRQIFDFEQGPLMHARLIKLSPQKHALLTAQPALCADTAALNNLLLAIERAYADQQRGESDEQECAQYADFSALLNELLEAEDMEVGRQHWRKQRLHDPFALNLPLENQLSPRERFAPESLVFSIPAEVAQQIAAGCREHEITPAVFLLACWQILLARLSGQAELTMGVACDGRTYDELQGALGLFAKFLPVNFQYNERALFAAVLQQVEAGAREIYEWQEYFSWQQIASSFDGGNSVSYFPFSFSFEQAPARASGDGVVFSMADRRSCFERFKISLSCSACEGGFIAQFHYDSSAYDEAYVERMAERYGGLLRSAASDFNAPLGDLKILSDSDKQQLLNDFNNTVADYQNDCTINQWFEAQALLKPDCIAVAFAGEQLTYGALDRQANKLANYLISRGVKTESLVAICMERSVEMVIGLLGIMKAGAAYLPLDPEYPKKRIDFLLQDSGASLLLTERRLMDSLAAPHAQVICFDECAEKIAAASAAKPQTAVTTDNLAYVIYTSGSTGNPKGVQITHRAIANRLLWMQAAYPLDEDDRVAQKTPFSFDASVWEFFVPLLAGAQVVLAKPGGHKDSNYLATMIAENKVTILQLVPSMLQIVLEDPAIQHCKSLRRVFCGGEALPGKLQQRFFERVNAELVNLYGPTETSIDASSWHCAVESNDGVVPIGKPLGNMQTHILDSRSRLMPVGVPGELHIGGVGLARGYWNRAETTAEKFIPDPFSQKPGARLYRSGDLARYRLDGSLEFLGRIDHQVKIRGFRIELGEIEAALTQYSTCREAAVIALEEPSHDKRLAAYVVAKQGHHLAPDEMRSFLLERLPDYMVPATFTILEAMPLTPNGKLDRRALVAIESHARIDSDEHYAAPRNPIEEILVDIWATVLGVERIGVHDDFFKSGGHSLLATQVVSRMREAFRVELSLRSIFESPTVAGLARIINTLLMAERGLPADSIKRAPRDKPLPLSFAQQRLWFLDQLEPNSAIFNIPTAVRLAGKLDQQALRRSLSEVVRRHESLRTTFATIAGQPMQVINPAGEVEMAIEDLTERGEEERNEQARRRANQEAQKPFDLRQGPLLRVKVLKLGEEDHIVVMVMHHIISDGWSSGILINELVGMYERYSRGQEVELAELEIQYGDFAQWQREWLSGEVLDAQLGYWRKQLTGAPPQIKLPTDRPRPDVQSYRGATESITVSKEVVEGLKALSQQEAVTMFMTLLAAFEILLHRYSGQTDIVVGTDVANRNRMETEGLIGFFVNQLVLRTDLSGDPTFVELLGRVREATLNAYTCQDVPFEMLVEHLKPERSLSYAPMFQVKLLLQNIPAASAAEASSFQMSSLDVERKTAQFDLLLNLIETEGEMIGQAEYSTDLFDASTIQKMIRHYATLLEDVVADPQRRISSLRLLSETETGGFNPSDFPDAALSLSDFENMVIELSKGSGTN